MVKVDVRGILTKEKLMKISDNEVAATYTDKDSFYVVYRYKNGGFSVFIRVNNAPAIVYKEDDIDEPIMLKFEYGPDAKLKRVDNAQ